MTDQYETRTEELPANPTVITKLLLKLIVAILDARLTPTLFTRKIWVRQENGVIKEASTFTITVEAKVGEIDQY